MARFSTTLKVRLRHLMPLGAALLGLLLALGLNLWIKRQQQAQRLVVKAPPVASVDAPPSETRLADSLLTDSILSIVQSYYVDPGRVDNRSLLANALASLAANPRIKTGVSPGAVWVEVDGDRRIFPLKEKPRYQDVLAIFSTLATMVDKDHVELPAGEAPEKNAPGSVALLNSMLAELDAHSALLSPEAYRELRQGTEGSFGGLGVLVGIRDNLLTVIKPLPRSPALRAGIKRKDRILGIDGLFTYGYSLDELIEYMRGDPGTDVNLSLLREGAHAPSELVLKREVIHVDSVTVHEIDREGLKVLHLTVENFASRTSREVLSAVKKFRAKHKVMHGLILDLRANPGGLLDQAVQVADLFLQDGVIVTTKGRREEVETADTGFDEVGFPVSVLIDGDSASASEIVAGALQDHGRAIVIGQPSFGKGSVQTIFELPGERALKLTIARYFTPLGRSIQNVGIIPDVWLQPVAESAANENLLGPYRYKNERFLKNHLEDLSEGDRLAPTDMRQPTFKSYYLSSAADLDVDDPKRTDRELDFALKIFDKIRATYGDKSPEGTARSSHWLGLAGPLLSQDAGRLDRQLGDWLKATHGVTWKPSTSELIQPRLELEIDEKSPLAATAGSDLKIAWVLRNREAVPVERVSLFVRSEMPGFETKEVLIGEVAAASTVRGELSVPIGSRWDEGPLLLRVGAAVDAWPSLHGAADYLVQVRGRPVASLTATAELAEEAGGKVPSVLEGREKAAIRVTITNQGEVPATAGHWRLANLAGSQISLVESVQELPTIAPGASVQISAAIVGGKVLYTSELGLGLLVESPDLKQPLRYRFAVKGLPNAAISANSIAPTSH